MRVLKFGGTSVADEEAVGHVTALVAQGWAAGPVVVVASAMAGVTDLLVAAADGAAGSPREVVGALGQRHRRALAALAPADRQACRQLAWRLGRLRRRLEEITGGRVTPALRDAVLAEGELLLVPVLAAALRGAGVPAVVVSSRRVLVTDSRFGDAEVDLGRTRPRARALARWCREVVPVVPGFSGADPRGRVTTLGRGGSDTSAAALGAALGAERVEIFTDVDGVLTAPPQWVPQVRVLPHLSYREAWAIAAHGGKVLHPKALAPCAEAGVALVVRNTFRPAAPGTVIDAGVTRSLPVACVTGRPWEGGGEMAVVAVVGEGVTALPGLGTRVCTALAEAGVEVRRVLDNPSPAVWRLLVDADRLGEALVTLHRVLVLGAAGGTVPALPVPEQVPLWVGAGQSGEEVCHG